ncbi:BnaAnng18950D [Brassica napus]|uniref:BnaAnng18950D protein n=1 Tax=Brassica napus TaxID=3708 RepID=A0A078JC36_BRANA|nr:BnaAnng18950D [Brassica napus]
MAAAKPSPTDTWDATLPGPPSRNNFGSSDLSASAWRPGPLLGPGPP